MNVLEQARQLLGPDVFALAQDAGRDAPELSDEQVARLREVLVDPAAAATSPAA